MQVAIHKINWFQFLIKRIQKQFLLLLTLIALFNVNSFAQAPANDEPCNAITITADALCNYQFFTNVNATNTVGPPAPGCALYNGRDVWFQVVVPAASNGNLKFDAQVGTMTDGAMAVYRGTCDNLQLLQCNDDASPNGLMPQITLNSLTVGTTLWIRFFSYNNNQAGTFGICVKYPGPIPANDDACNAIALPNPTTVCTYTTFTNESSTASVGAPAPGCANYQGNDVWFSVVVPAAGILKFDTQVGEMQDGGMAIYSGTCTNLTLIACDDNNSPNGLMPLIIAANLTPGSTIWIRVWSKGTTVTNIGSFGLCVSIPPPPPVNDDPCGAILITPAATCTYQTFSTTSATPSTTVLAPVCANYQGGDVWFKVIVPCEGKLIFDTQTGVITDGGMAVYRGTSCGTLQLLQCDADASSNGFMPRISLTSLTPGSTVWVRIWEEGNDNPGTFGLCVTIPPPPGPGASCSTATPFCSSNTYTFPNATNVPSLGGNGIYGCLGSTPNPFWYYMQMQTTGSMSILIQQTAPGGGLLDVDYALWGPFPTLNASCNNLTAANIVSCSYSTAGIETATIPNGQAGDFYVLLVTNFANQAGTITFQQTAGTGSTSCDIICTLASSNPPPVCPGASFDLGSSLVVGATYLWTGPNCFTSVLQNPTGVTAPSTPGTYIYTVTATTPSGQSCSHLDTLTVVAPPSLGADSTTYICSGSTKDLTTLYNTTGLTSVWTTFPAGVTVPTPAAVGVAGIYQLIATNSGGCKDTALVTVVVDVVTSTVVSTANETCTTPGIIQVTNPTGLGSFEYNIDSNPGIFQSGNTFQTAAGTYTIITRDSLGCIATSLPVTVGLTDDLIVNASPAETTICLGQSATIQASGNATSYAWTESPVGLTLNDPTSASPVATPSDNTVYTVTGTLGSCQHPASVNVIVKKSVFVNAGGPLNIDAGTFGQVLAVVTGPNTTLTSILWTPSEGLSATNILNPVVTPVVVSGVTPYYITITNSEGCTAKDTLVVNILPNCRNVRNAFSPNGDGKNDFWFVYDDFSCLKNVTVSVFNRYGSKVFDSKDYRNDWNGRYKGKTLPDGTYYAIVEFTLVTGKKLTVKTDLTILR